MAELKKLVIVSYYWPPSSGVGVKRWMFFAEELQKQGVKPIIITPSNPQFNVKDFEAEANLSKDIEVIKLPIWEPFALMQKLTGGKNKSQVKQGLVLEKEKQGLLDKIFIWIRGNLFIPDARKYWVKPASKFILNYLKNNRVDALVTTGPPHSMHLIGRAVKQKSNIIWVADFRDPWSNWDLLDKLNTSKIGKWYHKKLERSVLQNANLVLATSPRQAADLKTFGAQKTAAINNGFSPSQEVVPKQQFKTFRISHLGLLNELRNPVEFWEVLNQLALKNKAFKDALEISLYGIVGDSVKENFKKYKGLEGKVKFYGYLNQSELKAKMHQASVLLVIQNRSANATRIIPYKLYEYLPMERPIVQIGASTGDSNELIEELNAGKALDYANKNAMKQEVEKLFENWLKQKSVAVNPNLNTYSHPVLVTKLIAEINALLHDK